MSEDDYVLGTEAGEIARLSLQHRVWRSRMLDAFRRAGIAPGQTVIDVGAGPGYAALDLAEAVGAGGRVIALERSRNFLAHLRRTATAAGLDRIEAREHDVSAAPFGEAIADASWCRWLLSFAADPRRTVGHIARALKPGGIALFHEYADYGAWRTMPPDPDIDRFRALVVRSWRDAGGEPDAALHLPAWLAEQGMEIVETRPHIAIVGRDDPIWEWPAAFMAVNAGRLHQLGYCSAEEAGRFAAALERAPETSRMITPLVAEVVARKL